MPPKVRDNFKENTPIITDLNQKVDTTAEGAAEAAGSGMRSEDVLFLIDCLQNTTGGQVQVCNL